MNSNEEGIGPWGTPLDAVTKSPKDWFNFMGAWEHFCVWENYILELPCKTFLCKKNVKSNHEFMSRKFYLNRRK